MPNKDKSSASIYIALALTAGLALLPACRAQTPADTETAATASSGELTLALAEIADWQATGAEVTTLDEAHVVARIPGILSSLSVRAGDNVRKGQTIGTITDSQLTHQHAALAARATAADAQAKAAEAEYKRVQYLHENGVYADARLEQVRASASAARAEAQAAAGQKAALGALAKQGAIVAPADGRVLAADIPIGAPVAPGMVVARLTAGPAIVRLRLPESLAATVVRGANVRVTGTNGDEISGHVQRIHPGVEGGQVVADAIIPGLDATFVGRQISARVEAGRRRVLLVPATYVTTRYGMDYVTRLDDEGAARLTPVQLALASEAGMAEILSGAGAGDRLILPAGAKPAAARTTEQATR